jgi:hypothetical protein
MAKPTVEFSARVPREDFEEFKANFPQHGAVQWFISTALKEFNRVCSSSETIQEQVEQAIEQMLKHSGPSEMAS